MGGTQGAENGPGNGTLAAWRRLRPLFSIRAHMVALILAVMVPLLAFSAFLVLRSAAHQQELMANDVRERTQTAAATIDYDLGMLRARLFGLAASRALQKGDLAGFYRQASDVANNEGLRIVLSDPDGHPVIDTQVPYGAALPAATDPESVRRVASTHRPDVSDIGAGAPGKEPFIAISVPVRIGDGSGFVLSVEIASRIPQMIAQLGLPASWLVTISDHQGRTLARSREAERYVGQIGRAAIIEQFRAADSGWFPSNSREGIPVYNAFAHVRVSGWVVAVGIPDETLFAPVHRSTMILLLLGGAAIFVGLLLATLVGRRIARPISALVAYADAVGRGERLPLNATGVLEINAVARSLLEAGERLYRSGQERTELLHQIVAAQEAERKRIARELHDSLGQYLTALRLGLNAIEPVCASDARAMLRVEELKELMAELGREFSRMAWELRPMALDELGLKNAMANYLEEWAERSGLCVDLEITLGDRRLPATVETALFRVLQEAITNVVKHSGADKVGVILETMDGEVRLIVEDNGRGFRVDPDAAVALDRTHFGLLGVRERLALVDGVLEIESSPRDGTTVYAIVPIEQGTHR